MGIIAFLIAVSTALAICGVVFFVWLAGQRNHEHSDRLAFLPLEGGLGNTSDSQE